MEGTAAAFRRLPKVELHCHLDACVRPETVADIAGETGVPLPPSLREALVAPAVCHDLADYIARIDLALAVMQRPQDLRRIARELALDMAADGVVYGEVRFAPQLHTRAGLTLAQVLEAVSAGLREGRERTGIETGLIMCVLRHQPPELGRTVAALAAAHTDTVCALDLAGDEGRFPNALAHAPAFDIAREAGLRLTAHAGENAGAASIREVLDALGAERVGHGVRIEEDPGLVARAREQRIALDMCPTSNVQTRAVADLPAHPADRLLRQGLAVTISTDGRTVSGTTVTGEFERLAAQFGWGAAELLECQRHAARAAFAPERTREALLARIDAAAR